VENVMLTRPPIHPAMHPAPTSWDGDACVEWEAFDEQYRMDQYCVYMDI